MKGNPLFVIIASILWMSRGRAFPKEHTTADDNVNVYFCIMETHYMIIAGIILLTYPEHFRKSIPQPTISAVFFNEYKLMLQSTVFYHHSIPFNDLPQSDPVFGIVQEFELTQKPGQTVRLVPDQKCHHHSWGQKQVHFPLIFGFYSSN